MQCSFGWFATERQKLVDCCMRGSKKINLQGMHHEVTGHYSQIPLSLPCLLTLLEIIVWKSFKYSCQITLNVFKWFKSKPFQENMLVLETWEGGTWSQQASLVDILTLVFVIWLKITLPEVPYEKVHFCNAKSTCSTLSEYAAINVQIFEV